MKKRGYQIAALAICGLCLTSCGESPKMQPAALALGKHAVVNGVEDTLIQHKGVVGIYIASGGRYSNCSYSNDLICTGTLIHPKYVITAAHCVTNSTWYGTVNASSCNKQLRVGIGNDEAEVSKNLYRVRTITWHPNYGNYAKDYQYQTIDADIALIELEEEIPPTVALPIKTLPPKYGITREDLGDGLMMNFSGFGYSHNGTAGYKLQMDFPVTNYCGGSDDSSGCEAGSVTVNGCHPAPSLCSYYGYQHDVTEYILIPWGGIYYPQDEGGPCQGDSGGPAFLMVDGEEYLAGVTSYGDATCGAYGVSTATQDYYDWIVSLAPEVADLNREHCANGLDDDGNGLTDCDDPVCEHIFVCLKENCINGVDDNFDGLVDCDDPQCASGIECMPEICGNGLDDNLDGLFDCDDPQCENDVTCAPENCSNGIDDNLNGLTDCRDPQCANAPNCVKEDCTNRVDDNGNHLVDCDDPQCVNARVCQQEICDNGEDDNDDGLKDMEDPQCADYQSSSSDEHNNNGVEESDDAHAAAGGCSSMTRHSSPFHALPFAILSFFLVGLRRRKHSA